MRKSVAEVSQRLESPKTWIGSDRVNVMQVLADLIELVSQMNSQLVSHGHSPGAVPVANDAAMFNEKLAVAKTLSLKLAYLIKT